MHFTVSDIACLLGVSTSTITRHMCALGISVRQTYYRLSDHRLDQLVHEVTTEFPSAGYRLIQSHLRARGYRVTEHRVRLSLRRVDSNAVAVRWITHNMLFGIDHTVWLIQMHCGIWMVICPSYNGVLLFMERLMATAD